MTQEMFMLQNSGIGYCGNSPFWWSTKGGYTDRIDDASKFTEEEVDQRIQSSKSSHKFKKWPASLIESIAYRVCDIQELPKTNP